MILSANNLRLVLAAATAALLPAAAAAGWFGVRNDTESAVVVRETCVVNGTCRPGKPRTLYPGEAMYDGQPGRAARRLAVYDPRRPDTPLYQGPVPATAGDLFLSIRRGPKSAVEVVPVPAPPVVTAGRR